MRGRTSGVMVISVCAAVVAGCADKDEKTVAGRTTSASTAPSTTLVAALRRTRLYSVRADQRLAYGESVFHFVEVDVTPTRLSVRAVDAAGRVFDATTIDRP